MKDRELQPPTSNLQPPTFNLLLTPQFIGKDPAALGECLMRVKDAGFTTADLNAGCPYPMVRNKGRGSGLLRTPAVFERMIAVGCEVMGEGRFSVKTRLGVERGDELLKLMPMINRYPLRFLTVHGRLARQMYDGVCDRDAVARVVAAAAVPVVLNGDIGLPPTADDSKRTTTSASASEDSKRTTTRTTAVQPSASNLQPDLMIGRAFVRALGERDDIGELLKCYVAASQAELCGARPVLGRLKELVAYWKDSPRWRRRWQVIKLTRTVEELKSLL